MSGLGSPARQVQEGIGDKLRILRSRLQSREAAVRVATATQDASLQPRPFTSAEVTSPPSTFVGLEAARSYQRAHPVHGRPISGAIPVGILAPARMPSMAHDSSGGRNAQVFEAAPILTSAGLPPSRQYRGSGGPVAGMFASQLPVRVGSNGPGTYLYGSGVRLLNSSPAATSSTVTAALGGNVGGTSFGGNTTGIPFPRSSSRGRFASEPSIPGFHDLQSQQLSSQLFDRQSSLNSQSTAVRSGGVCDEPSISSRSGAISSMNSARGRVAAAPAGVGPYIPPSSIVEPRTAEGRPISTPAFPAAIDPYSTRSFHTARSVSAQESVAPSQFQRAPRGLVGLTNLGNTCFMNSVLACLSNVPPLANYFSSREFEAHVNHSARATRGRLAAAYGELMQAIWCSPCRPGAVETPSKLKHIVGTVASRFIGYDQQDAQELLRFLLDALHDDVNRVHHPPPYVELTENPRLSDADMSAIWWRNYSARNDSELSALFAGQLKTTVICSICKSRSRAFDPVWDWSLPIPKAGALRDKMGCAEPGVSGSLTLSECMTKFVEEEYLSGADAFFCRRCGKHEPCFKRTVFFRAPRVLVVHLKRFNFSFVRRSKITTPISFPLRGLDIRPFMDPESPFAAEPGIDAYRCVAISNHSGSLGGGHYTAHALNRDDGGWYLYNDSRVSKVTSAQLSGADAYLLFFVHDGDIKSAVHSAM